MPIVSTIAALSSGSLPSGVAVLRLSGPAVVEVLDRMCGGVPKARVLALRDIRRSDGAILDRGLVVFFPAPHSFTGEDCAELQVHGSRAVVAALLEELVCFAGVELAQAGDFTRRAFENGKLDATAVEGLGDLIAAETENQRRQALARSEGSLKRQVNAWRGDLLALRAEIEAQLDFSDEDDVPESLDVSFLAKLENLKSALSDALSGGRQGVIVRDGFRVALAGAPNSGKSSLLNALARSDIAIVTEEAGTTRDVREVPLNLGGQLVLLYDLAGIRETSSVAEAEGVRRAFQQIAISNLVVWLVAPDVHLDQERPDFVDVPVIRAASKIDIGGSEGQFDVCFSAHTLEGVDALVFLIEQAAQDAVGSEPVLVSHKRDMIALEKALSGLGGVNVDEGRLEIVAEALREASDHLARLTGEIDAEAVLDALFAGFCIGK